MKKNVTITFIVFLISTSILNAQSWQWGKNGGGSASTALSGDNTILDMKHDKSGNMYVLGLVTRFTAHFMGDTISVNGQNDLLLYKIDCNGNKIWRKQIGDLGSDDGNYSPSLQLDDNENVYVSGFSTASSTHGFRVDTETLFTPAIGQYFRSYIVKYDKNGNYKTFKTNETYRVTNSITYLQSYFGKDNYLYLLAIVGGNLLGVSDTINPKFYILKYDTSITLQSVHPISDSGAVLNWSVTGDRKGNLYIGGYTTPVGGPDSKITLKGGHQVRSAKCFLCKFDTSGTFKWITMNDDTFSYISKYKYNEKLDLIISTGDGGGQFVPGDTGTRYGSIKAVNPAGSGAPVIFVFDTVGNCLRGIGMGSNNISSSNDVDIDNMNNIIIGGLTAGPTFKIGGTTYSTVGQDAFYVKLNSNLEILGGEVLNGLGFYDAITRVVHDEKGNVYVGGYMESHLYIPGDTLYKIGGGASDLFIAKYGVPACNCAYTVSNFSDAFTSSLNYTYTSAASNADSIWWDFGDGNTQSGGLTATHAYTTSGNYTVCQHVSNDCSVDEFCKNVSVVTDINDIKDIKESYSAIIYPNPASSSVHIHIQGGDLPANCEYILFDVAGKQVLAGKITGKDTTIILPNSITDCMYLLKVNNEKGAMLLSKRIEIAR